MKGIWAANPLTRDIPKAAIEAGLNAEQEACEQVEAEEVEQIPEIEIVVPEAEACAQVGLDEGYPEGYDAENIIF